LFADDDFADIGGGADTLLPFLHSVLEVFGGFAGLLFGFFVLNIVVFTINEHDDIGILFDRAGFTQVRHDRTFIVTLFNAAVQLGQSNNRNVQFLGKNFQSAGNFRELLHAVAFVLFAAGTDD